jgi:hypothetical protein
MDRKIAHLILPEPVKSFSLGKEKAGTREFPLSVSLDRND